VQERTEFSGPGWTIFGTSCAHDPLDLVSVEPASVSQITIARHGVYVRVADGVEYTVVPASVHFFRADEEFRVAHPVGGEDRSTALTPAPAILEEITMPDGRLPRGSRPPDGAVLVLHMRLLSALRNGRGSTAVELVGDSTTAPQSDVDGEQRCEPFVIEQLATDLAAAAVALPTSSTDTVRRHQRRLADEALQVLASSNAGSWSLTELASCVRSTPCALSRAVSETTGRTLGEWWSTLRVWRALGLLAADGATLAGVAAAAGYSDQAHLTRALRRETGSTPAALRKIVQDC
jgi:AraC-like DNA-binding protein